MLTRLFPPGRLRRPAVLPLLAPLLLVAAACAPAEDTETQSGDSGSETTAAAQECAQDDLELTRAGTLTIGTDSPAYEPWFSDNDPSNGQGFESAVAYAVAGELGFSESEVTWVKVPFNNSYAPGEKSFDFDINQISITPERAKVVDFSEPYYTATQGLIALEGSDAASATTVEELQSLRLGAQTGTTSLTAIRDRVQPSEDPLVFEDTNAAKQALLNEQVDAIVADLPTAFYITAVEIPQSTIVGQFEDPDNADNFGLLLEKDNPLLECVDQALTTLREDGTLEQLEQRWLSDVVDVPVLQ